MADIDQALCEDEPPALTDFSIAAEKEFYAKWERSNRLCVLAFRRSIPENLKGGLPETTNAKKFLAKWKKGMSYEFSGGVRDYILKMVHIQHKQKTLEMTLHSTYIVHSTLNSLPTEFSQMKTAYNTQNESWSINDLISKCVVDEGKIKKKKAEVSMLASHDSKQALARDLESLKDLTII
ncbi:uncharacterized protein LOC107844218 [Capsicum annuum]|uniref:uncharacterized protein LOC107844218 n=1 Tax=Capsicum annuum TaxID=4072 RepID=UPI0007BEE8BE|nr:uncharacterized protein LOC107844218 [Capsicum annuum]